MVILSIKNAVTKKRHRKKSEMTDTIAPPRRLSKNRFTNNRDLLSNKLRPDNLRVSTIILGL